jgi:gliding motility-associated protein GldM
MAQVKLPPRQRMINMMYIVLIAMLALNVDKHVLKAFHLMEKNFISSASSYDKKNDLQMSGFLQLVNKEEEKARPYYEAAKDAQKISAEFDRYIEELKTEVIALYNGRLEEEEGEDGITSLKTPEGIEKHANFFLVQEKGKRAKELQAKINSTRDKLLALLKPDSRELFVSKKYFSMAEQANLLQANEPENTGITKATWATINLENQPVGALVANLTQYQNNAKALEADVISKLIYGVNQSSHIIDELNAAIIPQSNYVMEGENYQADVMLIATSSAAKPKITMNGNSLNSMEKGVGKINFKANGIGEKTIKGTIEVADPKTGKPTLYPYEHTYQVFKPVATVSAEELNLLYKTLDNPLSISVPGFSAADIKVTATGGASVNGINGKYNVKVSGTARSVDVTVFAKGKNMGTTTFRVRDVPPPDAMLGGIKNDGRAVSRAELCAQNSLLATLGDDFAYNLPFRVTSFRFIYIPKRGDFKSAEGTGNTLTPLMKSAMCGAQSGDRFLIENITATNSQYGITKSVAPMNLVVR